MKKLFSSLVMSMALVVASPVMAAGDVSAGKGKAMVCAACHGADGNSPLDMFPKLAGQHESYIAKQLADFKSGARVNAVMAPMVANLTEQDMADLGAFFASKKVTPGAVSEDLLAAGQTIYRAGNKDSGLPACMACHGPTGAGMPAAKWPALSGQYSKYVELQLKAFAEGTRSNDPNNMMTDIAKKMTADEMKAVSAYVAGLH
ncbi:MAG: cytochrome c4 [Gammaproteobacteria bacterium]|nr:MAG: cytochrome c4 [Gammaproteobacteria bacterium]